MAVGAQAFAERDVEIYGQVPRSGFRVPSSIFWPLDLLSVEAGRAKSDGFWIYFGI